jgi:hypothetical protein
VVEALRKHGSTPCSEARDTLPARSEASGMHSSRMRGGGGHERLDAQRGKQHTTSACGEAQAEERQNGRSKY